MKRVFTIAAIALTLMSVTMIPSFAKESGTSEKSEAAIFFDHLLKETNNPVIADLARQSLAKLQSNTATVKPEEDHHTRQVEVPFIEQIKSSLAVPMLLEHRFLATFVVDTGATYTVITPDLAHRLHVKMDSHTPKMNIMTANGVISAPMVTLNSVSIGGIEVHEVKAVVQDLGHDSQLSGLLGMNFFKNMDLTIKRNKLVISVNEAT